MSKEKESIEEELAVIHEDEDGKCKIKVDREGSVHIIGCKKNVITGLVLRNLLTIAISIDESVN